MLGHERVSSDHRRVPLMTFFDDRYLSRASFRPMRVHRQSTGVFLMASIGALSSGCRENRSETAEAVSSLVSSNAVVSAELLRQRAGGRAVLIVESAGPNESDRKIALEMQNLGFDVDTIAANQANAADLTDTRMVVISESTQSEDLSDELRDLPVPVLLLEPSLTDEMGFCGLEWQSNYGDLVGQENLMITSPTHILAAGFSGKVQVSKGPQKFVWGVPSSSAISIAGSDSQPQRNLIFAYERRAQMVRGVAPARRSFFFAGRDTPQLMTTQGWKLFRSMLLWTAQPRSLLVVDNESLISADEALRQRLSTSGYLVDVVAASALTPEMAVGYTAVVVSESSLSSDIGTKLTNAKVPLLVLEPSVFDDLRLTGPNWMADFGDVTGGTNIVVANPHRTGANLVGSIQVVSTPSKFVWGSPVIAEATIVAHAVGRPTWATVFALEQGAKDTTGQPLAHRRVGWFAGRDTPSALTTDGWKLFDAAIAWLVGGRTHGSEGGVGGNACGFSSVWNSEEARDPCLQGQIVGTAVLSATAGTGSVSIPFNLATGTTTCVQVVQSGAKGTPKLSLDSAEISTGKSTHLEHRQLLAAGGHSVSIVHGASLGTGPITVFVKIPFENAPSIGTVEFQGVTLGGPIASLPVLQPGSPVGIKSAIRIPLSDAPSGSVNFSYDVWDERTCTKVRTLPGTTLVSGLSQWVTGNWDGKKTDGQAVGPGRYLVGLTVTIPGSLKSYSTPFSTIRVADSRTVDECRKELVAASQAVSRSDPLTTLLFARQYLSCGNNEPSACEIDIAASVLLDRRTMVQAFVAGDVTFQTYLHFARDRTKKLNLGDDNIGWVESTCVGDGDGDLVPDNRDQCLDTPPMTPTDDVGCTDRNLPAVKENSRIREMLLKQPHIFSKCTDEVLPAASKLVGVCQDNSNGNLEVYFKSSTILEQHPECEIFLVLEAIFDGVDRVTNEPRKAILGVALGATVPHRYEYRQNGSLKTVGFTVTPEYIGGTWQDLAGTTLWQNAEWTLTTMNSQRRRSGVETGKILKVQPTPIAFSCES